MVPRLPRSSLGPTLTDSHGSRAPAGLRRDAGGVHPVGHPRRAAAPRGRRRAHDVHLPGRAGLRHPAPAAGGVPGLRDGLPRGQRLLLPLLLGPRRGRGDRGGRHAARGAAGAGAPLRLAQRAPGGQAARVQGTLHHRPGCWRRRGHPLRHALRMVLRRQERRSSAGAASATRPSFHTSSTIIFC
ncbi:Phosphatidylcholine:diacylglycerol cholinephosphotransferase 1 [Zea mays]|uniref:Phosphatidylcholine:diacylglycerol cholinephosphotransferase 1 n=1 Tax=Zea mays TaxID=4577 RepID=A0A1D6P379_MAIZE|nr:Phosphatidylcholine:diacylglycerol cholinephosphotransferase 1 [Zea mays]